MTAARAVVDTLVRHGVDRLFCVAGESYLAVLDALYDAEVDVVTCRHEGSAGFMAVADAKLTGRPSVCLVNRAPGATNAGIALQAAAQDATPFVLVVGHVTTGDLGREAFQEVDYAQMFGGVAKGVWTLLDADRAEELTALALHVAASDTPGPTVLVVPEDVLDRPAAAADGLSPARAPARAPARETVDAALALLAAAQRPLVLAGRALDTPAGRAGLLAASERHVLPVVTTNKHQHLFDNRHPHYAGHLHNATPRWQLETFDRADLVLAIGTRLDEVATRRGRFPRAPLPDQPLVHAYPDPAQLGRRHRPALPVACDPAALMHALGGDLAGDRAADRSVWAAELHAIEVDKAVWDDPGAPDGVLFGAVIAALDGLTGGEVTVTVDSGVFTSWVYRYLRFAPGSALLGIASSAMGFGVPAAVAAALRRPGTPVVCAVGDGGFLMNGSELATAVARRLPLVLLVSNNGTYGTIRLHQERTYPGRRIATDLVNPDFARLAEAYGALGLTVREDEDIEPALARALEHRGPVVVDVHTSVSRLTPPQARAGEQRPAQALAGVAGGREAGDGRP